MSNCSNISLYIYIYIYIYIYVYIYYAQTQLKQFGLVRFWIITSSKLFQTLINTIFSYICTKIRHKYSYTIFCLKMSKYSHITFCNSSIKVGSNFLLVSWPEKNCTIFQDATLQTLILHLSLFLSALRFSNLICLQKSCPD